MLPYIVAGLTTGSIFAIAALGLVLTYKTSGIFNLGHGALASASAFLLYFLFVENGLPWQLAVVICVFVWGPLVGLVLELLARKLTNATLTMKILATVGILLSIQGSINLLYTPGASREVPKFLPTETFMLGDTSVAADQIITFVLGIVIVVALTMFMRWSRSGLAMRAVVDNTELLDTMGISPARTRRIAWMIGSSMASAAGVLLAPLLPLDSTTLTLLVVTAFGAAAIGGFTNLPMTYLGGLGIGVGQALLQKWFSDSTGLAGGLSATLPFLILFAVLVCAPRLRRPSAALSLQRRVSSTWTAPWTVRLGGMTILMLVLLFVPQFAGAYITNWTRMLAYVILFLSLGVLVRMSGQVSLGHVGFMAIGVVAFAHMVSDYGWPWLLALLFAAAVAAPIGAILAIPAIRFPGLYLALATLGFGLMLQYMFYSQDFMFGQTNFGMSIPRPSVEWADFESDSGYYYLVLAFAVIASVLVFYLAKSRLGRLLTAMSDSPMGLEASGAAIKVTRVLVFCISASLAAVAGVLDAASLGVVGSESYDILLSVQLFAVVLLVVGNAPFYAVMAAAAQMVIPGYLSTDPAVTAGFTLLFGVSAILVSISPPQQLPKVVRDFLDRLAWPRKAKTTPEADVSEPVHLEGNARVSESVLKVEDLVVRFGGLVASDHVTIEAPTGKITGLIGPNGAGKSTLFNACSGIIRPDEGVVSLGGHNLGRSGPAARARRGLGRTFQQMELFDSLTVRQNVEIGTEAAYAGNNPIDHLFTKRRQRLFVTQRASEAIALCDLATLADRQVGSLSTGQRRLVELARCVSGRYDLLLLDEPSSGLDHSETHRFGEVLQTVTRERGVGILLIEHDMALINQLCEYVYVIDFGKPLFQGTVDEVGASEVVRRAYLGEEGLGSNKEAIEMDGTRA